MPNTATRLITLILILQRKPNQKAADLAAHLDVSVRTIHRYLLMLEEMGIPIYSERGPQGGFSLVRGYKMPPLVFTPQEAVAIYLGAGLVSEVWGELYQSAVQGALVKLDNVLPDEQRREAAWARRSIIATGFLRNDMRQLAPVLNDLKESTRLQKAILIEYRSRGTPKAQARKVDPYLLLYRYGWWYLVGFCHRRQGVRTFRVDRIVHLSPMEEAFELPGDFDIEQYIEREWGEHSQIEARLRFDPEYAFIAHESRSNWDEFVEQPDGSVEVMFKAPDLVWAASMALGFGPVLRVCSPPELAEMIRNWAEKIVERSG